MSRRPWLFWTALAALWLLATAADRAWLASDGRLPSWDQADYLNSALDHGRALGMLPAGGWQGWQALLDLSPKIPPLASLVNGTVMAVAGDAPDQASWSLSLWHGLLLLLVALWGRQLGGAGLGLLAALVTVLLPSLAAQRVDYVLEIPVAAAGTGALWLLGRWARPAPSGGGWGQALVAALALAAAVLIKQSVLLLLLGPLLWAAATGLARRGRRLQVLAALALVLALVAPWLGHNLITTVSGTDRATLESAAREGDPGAASLAGWLWYPQRLPQVIGWWLPSGALAGALLALRRGGWSRRRLGFDQGWLLGCLASAWLLTTLSPNKDARYLAPLLPLLALLLAQGWRGLAQGLPTPWGALLAGVGLAGAAGTTIAERLADRQPATAQPLEAVVAAVQNGSPATPRTLIVVPSTPQLNQHNISYYGRRGGGALVGRQLGSGAGDTAAVLAQGRLVLLATGDQGSVSRRAAVLSEAVRSSGLFRLRQRWPRPEGGSLDLWERRAEAPPPPDFAAVFPDLAAGLARGPAGLGPVSDAVGREHQLDGHRLYQQQVQRQALQTLALRPDDRRSLWSLALLATLQNRPLQADHWFARLEALEPASPWPAAYRSVVLTAAGRPWQGAAVAEAAGRRTPDPVLTALADLDGLLSGRLWRLPALQRSLPRAVDAVKRQWVNPPESGP
jgi:4-amino-4-deoxy-L-arabinose transferase-like glycosyltransferase